MEMKGAAMSELEKNSDTFVLFNSHYQVYLAIGTGTLMIEANVVHTTASPETARTFSIYAQAREFMNLLNEYHDKEFEAWGVINSEYIDFFCKVAEPQPQLTIPKSIADELKEAIGATNFESTPYSIKLDEEGYLKMWASLRHKKLSDKTYKFCRDNTRVFDAYLNPLTRDLVKVVEE